MALAYSHGIFPLVYKTLKNYDQKIPSEILNSMKYKYMNIVKQNMLMTNEVINVTKLLKENGIESIAFKGPVLSHLAYGDVVSRQYVDLDILVDKSQLLTAIKILNKFDYVLEDNFKLNLFKNNRVIFHDITLRKNTLLNIELHWQLFSDEYMTGINELNIKENTKILEYQNNKLKVFDNEIQVLYLSIHGAKHNWERIEWLVDIVRFIENNQLNWERLIYLIDKTKTEKILFSTLYLCKSILNLFLPKDILIKIEEKDILNFSKRFEVVFYENFDYVLHQNTYSKNISKIQFDILYGYKNKLLFIFSLIKPTELDYNTLKLPKYISFLYYIIRPFNLLIRKIRSF